MSIFDDVFRPQPVQIAAIQQAQVIAAKHLDPQASDGANTVLLVELRNEDELVERIAKRVVELFRVPPPLDGTP